MLKNYRISFCIACMNRLHHLKASIFQNIEDNSAYKNLEFVLLDYNSGDGMGEWVKENLSQQIKEGLVVYYRIDTPEYFNHSHAKNVALKLGSGEIVCSVNADHYLGKGFASYVDKIFRKNKKTVITPIPSDYYNINAGPHPLGSWGKVCLLKSEFLNVYGFDEQMYKYGNDDIDLVNRLSTNGLKIYRYRNTTFSKTISHENEERYSSIIRLNRIYKIFRRLVSHFTSEFIFLFEDHRFENIELVDEYAQVSEFPSSSFHHKKPLFRYSVKDYEWLEGTWKITEERLELSEKDLRVFTILQDKNMIRNLETGIIFEEVTEERLIGELNVLNYTHYNLNRMRKNISLRNILGNQGGFGHAVVYKNFDIGKQISI